MNILSFLSKFRDYAATQSEEELTNQLRESIVWTGSETPDNKDCAASLSVQRTEPERGPTIICRDSRMRLGDLCWLLEDDDIIALAASKFRDDKVSPQDVSAAFRLMTLIATSIDESPMADFF